MFTDYQVLKAISADLYNVFGGYLTVFPFKDTEPDTYCFNFNDNFVDYATKKMREKQYTIIRKEKFNATQTTVYFKIPINSRIFQGILFAILEGDNNG